MKNLIEAIVFCNLNAVREALDAGADPNARDHAGLTPLDWAAWAGSPRIAALLRERGATGEPISWRTKI